jgi:glycine cleavage system H protein
MSETRYTEEHEWVRLEEDGNLTFGITDHAQDALGDVVYVELPDVGQAFGAGDEAAVVESVKAAGEIKMPLAGIILEVNTMLVDKPELVNSDPEGDGWFFKLNPENLDGFEDLMTGEQYQDFIE